MVTSTANGTYLPGVPVDSEFPLVPYVDECPADLNYDHVVDGLDLAMLLANWGGRTEGDFNCDGIIDGFDLAILLAA